MTIGVGYYIGGLVLILYGIMCFYIGFKKPTKLFKITKLKVGKKKSDETVVKICYVFSAITIIAGIIVLTVGFLNA